MTPEDLTNSALVFLYVMVVMTAIVLAVSAMGLFSRRSASKAKALPQAKEVSEELLETDELSSELVAVIAAAAAEAIAKPVRLRSVRLHRDADQPSWANAGRIDIMLSHRVGPRR